MRLLVALASGLLFGWGLALSQMMDPAKVLNFLDVFGQWDPSLLLVMGGALAVSFPGFFFVLKRSRPWLDARFHLPDVRVINRQLLLGAVLFGLGWGLAGLCPGPAVAGLATGNPELVAFVVAMLAGYVVVPWFERRL